MTVDLTGAHALTLRNPWAHLIAHRGKNVENRTWMPPEHVSRLLIHAGKGWDDSDFGNEWKPSLSPLATSAIVAVADLAHACDTSRWTDRLACPCNSGWAMPGQCHWNLTNVHTLAEPVPCSGRQGLWRPSADVTAAVRAQLAAARPTTPTTSIPPTTPTT